LAINLGWLTALREVADTGSYTRASESLFLSQPAVSQQIRQLEGVFGAKLIRRVGLKLELTEAGRLVYESAIRIETELAATRDMVAELTMRSERLLTIASSPTPLLHRVPKALGRLWVEHPEVAVKTLVRSRSAITESVKSGAADLGIVSHQFLDSSLAVKPLAHGRIVAVSSPRHELAKAGILEPEVVTQHKVAITGAATVTRQLLDKWFLDRGITLRNVMEVSSHEEIRIAVRDNLAIGFVVVYAVAEDIAAGRMTELHLRDFEISRPSYLVYRKDIQKPASWLIELLVEEYKEVETS